LASKKEKLESLAAVPLFRDLSNRDLGRILENSKEVDHSAGQTVVSEGHEGAGFHMILSGNAKVVRGGRTVATLSPGEYFGEMALLDGGRRTATVVADTDLVTLYIAQWGFKPLVRDNPQMAWKLVVHLTKRLREEQKGRDALTH
jgi:CRP/FNR family transcriptional regulator, cyclic AMP receptor protein